MLKSKLGKLLETHQGFRIIVGKFLMSPLFSDQITYESKNGIINFDDSEAKTEAFERSPGNENYIWKVYSTINQDGGARKLSGVKNTWDMLAFAFYFKDDRDTWRIPSKLFKIETRFAGRHYTPLRELGIYRPEEERAADQALVRRLRENAEGDNRLDSIRFNNSTSNLHFQ